jgi:hypothetical protein
MRVLDLDLQDTPLYSMHGEYLEIIAPFLFCKFSLTFNLQANDNGISYNNSIAFASLHTRTKLDESH